MKISSSDLPKIAGRHQCVYIACHSNPDMDSVSSAWALKTYFESIGIKPKLICVDPIPQDISFLLDASSIALVDPINNKELFSSDDLLVLPDIANWMVFNGETDEYDPGCKTLRIDHHNKGRLSADYEIVEPESSSTCEIVFGVFEQLGFAVDKLLANVLLAGILTDTGAFVYSNATAQTFKACSKLIELGADKESLMFNLFKCIEPETYKLLGVLASSLQVFDEGFVMTTSTYNEISKLPLAGKSAYIDGIIQTVSKTNFGVRVSEKEPGVLYVSFRSRFPALVDVSELAASLGGGGHKAASAVKLKMEFNEGVEYLKSACREFAKKYEIPTK